MTRSNSLSRRGRKSGFPVAPVLLVGFAVAGLAALLLVMELSRTDEAPADASAMTTTVANTTTTPPAPRPETETVSIPAPSTPPADSTASADDGYKPYIVPAGRSPLPQPGESFDRPIPAPRLATIELASLTPTADPPAEGETVPYTEAHKHIGREITVAGKIVDTHLHRSGNLVFLNFEPYPSKSFYLVVFEPAVNAYPKSPEKYFLNQHIHVTGTPEFHKDRVQIQVRLKDQLKRVPAPKDAEPGEEAADAPDEA